MKKAANKYSSGGGHFSKTENGFTLIELLAVIIILGILLIIAIPSVTEYIVNSRKKAYISSIDSYVSGVSQKVNSLEYSFLDKNVTYYVHIDNVHLEKGGKSPFGEWLDAYVVVTYSGSGYDYYWTSVDDDGNKIVLKDVDEITVDDIISDSEKTISKKRAIGDRENIIIIDRDGNIIEEVPTLEYTKVEADECYDYSIADNKVTILSYSSSCSKDVIIPTQIGGYNVTTIATYAFSNKGITSVKLPETLIEINSFTFSYNKLREIFFPKSVVKLGNGAFANNLLTELPDISMITSLGGGVFSNNKFDDSQAFIYAKNSDGTFNYEKIVGYAGTSTDLVIPSSKEGVQLKTVGNGAFRWITLNSVVLPEGLEKIEADAFRECGLSSVKLPSTLKSIGNAAFTQNKLTSIEIPSSVNYIEDRAFNNNQFPLESAFIYARKNDGSIDYSTIVSYAGKNKDNVIIPEVVNGVTLKKINSFAFYGIGIKNITIPNSVIFIGNQAFNANYLSDEQAFIYKRTEAGIDYSTIIGYGGLKKQNIIIPSEKDGVSLTMLDIYAFSNTGVESVVLPEGLLYINTEAFGSCRLSEITIPSTVVSIGKNAFIKDGNATLKKIVNKSGKSFDWKSITGSDYDATFTTGTIRHQYGNIIVGKG